MDIKELKSYKPEQISAILKPKIKYLSLSSINNFIRYNSASRGYMASSAINGFTQVLNPQERIVISTDKELGKGVMNVTVDRDAVVKRVFIKRSPNNRIVKLTIAVVYIDNGVIDFIDVPLHSDNNYAYGFRYIWEPIIEKILTGIVTELPKGIILARTPGSKINGGYAMGYNLNTLFVSHPTGAEDTYLLSESKAKEMELVTYTRVTIEYGTNSTLLNLYGNEDEYKPFPDIGEYVRADRLLCGTRQFDETNVLALGSRKDLCKPSQTFDNLTYLPHPNGRVIDIEYVHTPRNKELTVHNSLDTAIKYINNSNDYYREIVNFYESIEDNIDATELTPHVNNSIVNAIFRTSSLTNNKIEKRYKRVRLDTYRVTFTIEHILTPENGYKFTNLHGGKGVVIIKPDNEMPKGVDLMAPIDSVIKRMNIGSLYEPYVAGVSREVKLEVQKQFMDSNKLNGELAISIMSDVTKYVKERTIEYFQEDIERIDRADITNIWELVLQVLKPIGNVQYKGYSNLTDNEKREILKDIFLNEFYIYYTPEDIDIWRVIEEWDRLGIKPKKHNISFQQRVNGKYIDVNVKESMSIVPMHFIMLSKIPFDGLLVNTANINHYGLPVTVTTANKHRLPYKANPAKFLDETFSRLLAGYAPERGVCEILDRASSPFIQEQMCTNILKADIPTNIPQLIDRTTIPYGNSKSLELVNHVLNTAGAKISYIEDPNIYINPKGEEE